MAKRKAIKQKKKTSVNGGGLSTFERKELEREILKELTAKALPKENKPKKSKPDTEEELFKEFNKYFESEIEKEIFKPTKNVQKASPIKYDKDGMKKLRNTIRKSDGTFFSKKYYENLLKQIGGKSKEDFDDALILLRNKNPKVRYYIDAESYILYFQVGNFIDRLGGNIQTIEYKGRNKKYKRSGKLVKTGEFKKGTKVTVTDFFGDEDDYNSVIKVNDKINEQSKIIDKVILALSPNENNETKKGLHTKPKRKGTGIYVLIEENVTSNSEKEVVKISYNYANYEVQGIEKYIFAQALDEVLHS